LTAAAEEAVPPAIEEALKVGLAVTGASTVAALAVAKELEAAVALATSVGEAPSEAFAVIEAGATTVVEAIVVAAALARATAGAPWWEIVESIVGAERPSDEDAPATGVAKAPTAVVGQISMTAFEGVVLVACVGLRSFPAVATTSLSALARGAVTDAAGLVIRESAASTGELATAVVDTSIGGPVC